MLPSIDKPPKEESENKPVSVFDERAFLATPYEPRYDFAKVVGLDEFFGEGQALIKVRGLTESEKQHCQDITQHGDTIPELLKKISQNSSKDTINQVSELLGLDKDEVHRNCIVHKRYCMYGIVSPALEERTLVKLMTTHPQVFTAIYLKIIELTNLGHSKKKLKNTGTIQK